MDTEFNDLQSVVTFVSDVSEGNYHMAREDWLEKNYRDASGKLLVWLFNHVISLEQRINVLEKALEGGSEVEEDDKH